MRKASVHTTSLRLLKVLKQSAVLQLHSLSLCGPAGRCTLSDVQNGQRRETTSGITFIKQFTNVGMQLSIPGGTRSRLGRPSATRSISTQVPEMAHSQGTIRHRMLNDVSSPCPAAATQSDHLAYATCVQSTQVTGAASVCTSIAPFSSESQQATHSAEHLRKRLSFESTPRSDTTPSRPHCLAAPSEAAATQR